MDLIAAKLKHRFSASILVSSLLISAYGHAADQNPQTTAGDLAENQIVETIAADTGAAIDVAAVDTGIVATTGQSVAPTSAENAPSSTEASSRMLPIWGDQARAKGYELPEPFGAGYAYMRLHQDIVVDKIGFIMPNNPKLANGLKIDAGETTQISETHLAKFDAWIFPFMSVYGLLGTTKGSSSTILEGGSYKKEGRFGTITLPLPIKGEQFNLDFEGDTYGLGTTLAGGYKNSFAMVDINYTRADLDILDGEIKALVITPRIGYTFNLPQMIEGHGNSKLQLWTGAMYQDVTQSFQGNIQELDLPPALSGLLSLLNDPNMKFSVDQHLAHQWNALVGARLEVTPRFNLTTEVGFHNRKTFMFSGEYRF